jgi:hypothetical protein
MSDKMVDLVVDFCSHQAAKYAVEHWHYSKRMPKSKLVKFGVWEDDIFVGAVIFGYGATNNIGKPFNLEQNNICELNRVALSNHNLPVSKIVATAITKLKKQSPKLRLIVSYADSEEGHLGTIYQAMNFFYIGESIDSYIVVNGKREHRRVLGLRYGTNSLVWIRDNIDRNAHRVNMLPKHKYLYPLDKAMRRQISKLAQPYPKREDMRAIDGNNLVSNQARQFDSDPSAYELQPKRVDDE